MPDLIHDKYKGKKLFKLFEAAEVLDMHPETFRRLRKKGKFAHLVYVEAYPGEKGLRVTRASLDDHLQSILEGAAA